MLAVITGIPGSGKSTLTKHALQKLEAEGITYQPLNYGDVMFEMAKEENVVENRDQMRKLDPKKQAKIQKLAAKKIYQRSQEENILLDTHCTISTNKGYIPGLPLEILKELDISILVIVESKAEEIKERRQSDKSRQRDKEPVEVINLHQELNRSMAMTYSAYTKSPVKIIQNPQGEVEEASKKLAKNLKF